MKLEQLRELVTPAMVRDALDDQIYRSLTGENVAGDDSGLFMPRPATNDSQKAATTACQSAARWAFITLSKADALARPFSDDEQAVLSESMTQRAIYELGRQSEFDANFFKNKQDAQELMNALLGLNGSGDGTGTASITSARSTKDASHRRRACDPFNRFR